MQVTPEPAAEYVGGLRHWGDERQLGEAERLWMVDDNGRALGKRTTAKFGELAE